MPDMARVPLPPLAAVVSFIDCINRGDIDGLATMIHAEHRLVVLNEEPVVGHAANVEAWKGYLSSFPTYVVYPRHIAADGSRVAVLGAKTGSHLGLPDEDERSLSVIWLAGVKDGALWVGQVGEGKPVLPAGAWL